MYTYTYYIHTHIYIYDIYIYLQKKIDIFWHGGIETLCP